MNADDVNKLVGLPYAEGGMGPDAFNCWGLLSYVQLTHFSKKLPNAPIGNSAACIALFEKGLSGGHWLKQDFPSHGCGVLMRDGQEPHVGVYLDIDGGGVIHSLREVGVTWTPMQDMVRRGYRKATYYGIENEL